LVGASIFASTQYDTSGWLSSRRNQSSKDVAAPSGHFSLLGAVTPKSSSKLT